MTAHILVIEGERANVGRPSPTLSGQGGPRACRYSRSCLNPRLQRELSWSPTKPAAFSADIKQRTTVNRANFAATHPDSTDLVSSAKHTQFRWLPRAILWLCLLATGVAAPAALEAVTLNEMLDNPKLNAKKYASYFGGFGYEFSPAIQSPEVFLGRERGDCDDYAVLADFVLKKRGLGTRLIHVRLAGRVAHAICYVNESGAYLDYNNRNVFFTLARSGPNIRDIAGKVASSLSANWTTASEFVYSYDTHRKTMISTVSQTGGSDTAPGQNSPFHVQ
jgi:hypothetical protein